MKTSLCLSLGHNSSAVLVDSGFVLGGYENERITGIKSDSQFPIHAIRELGEYHELGMVEDVYISHWATFGQLNEMSIKHWNPALLREVCPQAKIIANIDHHDCHVAALRAFADRTYDWEMVADGFGNFNETISIYRDGQLVKRVFGFEKSLGLLYQYTTAYLGLKMNQDEYKLLGYEAHITSVLSNAQIDKLNSLAAKRAKKMFLSIGQESLVLKYDLVAGLMALPNIRLDVHNMLDRVLNNMDLRLQGFEKRVVISFFVQRVVEQVMEMLVIWTGAKEIALTGGLFMNVKLNNMIAKIVKKICVMPVCGDQSGGLGAYNHVKGNLFWPDDLFWGQRNLHLMPLDIPGVTIFKDSTAVYEAIRLALRQDKIVNFVGGDCEFGARALGNTSTIALPTVKNVEYINTVNQRSTIMPMAGMVNRELLSQYKDADKVDQSLGFMIITLDHKHESISSSIQGCHHKDPLTHVYTNRVQLVPTNGMYDKLIQEFGMLINTSFNIHGQPIVLNVDQIITAHKFQTALDIEQRILTFILR